MSMRTTVSSTRYAPGALTSWSCSITRDSPSATIQASKLMQIRRKVSGSTLRMSQVPAGIPRSTAGAIGVTSAALPRVKRARVRDAHEGNDDSPEQATAGDARKTAVGEPWFLERTPLGRPNTLDHRQTG